MSAPAITIRNVERIDIKSQMSHGSFTSRDIVIVMEDGSEIAIELFSRKQESIKVEVN